MRTGRYQLCHGKGRLVVIIVNNAKDNQDSVQMVEQLTKEQVKCLTCCLKIGMINPETTPTLKEIKGYLYETQRFAGIAIEEMEIGNDPSGWIESVYNRLGYALLSLKHLEEAVDTCEFMIAPYDEEEDEE